MVQLRSLSYDKSDVVLVCFSVADPAMFVNVEKFWVNEIRFYLPRTPFLLVGTHLDVKDQRTSVSRLIIHNNTEFSSKPFETCSATSPRYNFKDYYIVTFKKKLSNFTFYAQWCKVTRWKERKGFSF